jgi:hypothetical protein
MFCPLAMTNGGVPCDPIVTMQRSSVDSCVECEIVQLPAPDDAMDTAPG